MPYKLACAWLPILSDPEGAERLGALARAMPPACCAIFPPAVVPEPGGAPQPHTLLDGFLRHLVDRAARSWGRDALDRRRKAPEGLAGDWWSALWSDDGRIDLPPAQRPALARFFGDGEREKEPGV